ncbi:MAG: NAD(P)-binding domain-containing protein, partial [Bacteroidota bacterium]
MLPRKMSIALIGAGPVGTAIAVRSRACGHRIAAIVSRRAPSARRLAGRVGCSLSGTRVRIIPPDVDLVVLAVPDGA